MFGVTAVADDQVDIEFDRIAIATETAKHEANDVGAHFRFSCAMIRGKRFDEFVRWIAATVGLDRR